MIFDNGWIDVTEVDKLPPLYKTCQVLVKESDESFFVTMERITQHGEGFASWPGRKVIAHQPLALPPTPAKQTLVERLLARTAGGMSRAMAMEIIGIIDEERAKDAPFGKDDMENLRSCYTRALSRENRTDAIALARAIARLEVVT